MKHDRYIFKLTHFHFIGKNNCAVLEYFVPLALGFYANITGIKEVISLHWGDYCFIIAKFKDKGFNVNVSNNIIDVVLSLLQVLRIDILLLGNYDLCLGFKIKLDVKFPLLLPLELLHDSHPRKLWFIWCDVSYIHE